MDEQKDRSESPSDAEAKSQKTMSSGHEAQTQGHISHQQFLERLKKFDLKTALEEDPHLRYAFANIAKRLEQRIAEAVGRWQQLDMATA
jgi:hypothetical protein